MQEGFFTVWKPVKFLDALPNIEESSDPPDPRQFPIPTGSFFDLPATTPGDSRFRYYDDPLDRRFYLDWHDLSRLQYQPHSDLETFENFSLHRAHQAQPHIHLEGLPLPLDSAMATDVITQSVPEMIQYYWQRIEKFHWLPDSEEALLHHLLQISERSYDPHTPTVFFNHTLPAFHNNQTSTTILFRLWIRPALGRLLRRLTATNADFFHIPWDEINRFPNSGPDRDPPPGGATGTLPGSPHQTTTTQAQRASQNSTSTSWGWAASDAQPSWSTRSTSSQPYWYTRSTNNQPPRHNVSELRLRPVQSVINTVRNNLTIHEHLCIHHILVILTRQYAEMDSALKHERDILIATTLLTNGTLSSLRRAHATSTRRSLLHDDKSIQGQLERIDLIIESSEHLQAQRDNIFLSDLDILSANLSFYCRHLLQIIDTTVTTLLDILPAYQTGSEHTSASDSNSRESLLLRIQTLIHSHGLRLESLITSANPLICELLQPQWHNASVHFTFPLPSTSSQLLHPTQEELLHQISSSLSRIKVPTHYGDLPRLIVLTQAHLLIQPSTRFLIQPFAQYNLNDFSSRIREHLPTQSLTPFDPSTIDRDDRHPINQESAGSSDTRNHSQLPSATNNDSQPLFFYRSTSNQIPQAPFLMPILSDAVLHNYHNFLWDIPILSQTHLIRNCWIIRNLCQLDHNNTDIQSLTRHHIPKRTYQIRPESSRRNPNMVSTPIRAPNVVINEPSRAVDHPPCTNPLRSDCVTPIIAQSYSTPTIVLTVHDANLTLPPMIPPEPSTPNSSNPRTSPGPAFTLTSPFPPSPSPSPVQRPTEIACPDCCSLPSSFSFPLDLVSSNALESPPSNALHPTHTEVSNLAPYIFDPYL